MSKYQLIHELCESRIFRSKASIKKYGRSQLNTLLYSILLSEIALALDPKTNTWARKYASRASAFGNFDYFRPSGNDLYILTHIAQEVTKSISLSQARSLLRIYKSLAKGDVESGFAEQVLIRLERSLGIKEARLRQARLAVTHWSKTNDADQKQTIMNLHRIVRLHAKIAEVLPYLLTISKDEAGHFGKMTPGKAAAALAGAGLAGLALGLRFDPNKKGWRVFRNSAVFDGEKLLTEDRPTQLFHIVQNLNHHPDIERIVSVHYITDGISAFVRDTQGNAYEIEIRPAPFAKGHEEKRGVTEDRDNDPECPDCYDTGWATEQHWEDKVNVPCDCKNAHKFRESFLQKDVWQWRIVGVLNEHGEQKINHAAVISLTPDDLCDLDDHYTNNRHDGPDTEAEVQKYLKDVRDRYDVDIVTDFLKYTGQDGEIS